MSERRDQRIFEQNQQEVRDFVELVKVSALARATRYGYFTAKKATKVVALAQELSYPEVNTVLSRSQPIWVAVEAFVDWSDGTGSRPDWVGEDLESSRSSDA